MAPMMRSYSYTEDQFYKADGADVETAALRKKGMNDLAQRFKDLFKESHKAAETVLDGLSDMRFTDTNRVPFPCQKIVREKLNVFNMVTEARGAEVKDLDGNWFVCTENDVPLVFDEVYTGFRLARGGAQEYFGVKADMVVYGKTIGGGMPNGLVCGPKHLMRRFDPDHPLRVSYVIGTFAAHPLLLGSMNEFIKFLKLESTP
eukprot:gene22114-26647_t